MELTKLRLQFDKILGYDNTELNNHLWSWVKEHAAEISNPLEPLVREKFAIDDYVFVSKYSDEDPNDPWYVSQLAEIGEDKKGKFYRVAETNRYWRHCRKITKQEGAEIIANYPNLEVTR